MAELARIQGVVPERREHGAKALRLSFTGARAALEEGARPAPVTGGERTGRLPLWSHFRVGQLLELSGHTPGKLSMVARLIARAQAEGEPVAWVGARDVAGFYPPDFAHVGIDLAALVVVRMPVDAGSHALLRASEVLLRSGAFGVVVLDLAGTAGLHGSEREAGGSVPRGELAWQSRLSGLVRKHAARMVLLTGSAHDAPSLGPLIGLRATPDSVAPVAARASAGKPKTLHPGRALLSPRVLKSKLGEEATLSPDLRSLPVGAYWG